MSTSTYHSLLEETKQAQVQLLAVSKTKTPSQILELYELGQRDFGENYVQELVDKQKQLPPDIRWHFIGHLQSNKVKLIAPFVFMIQAMDSIKLLLETEKQAVRNGRTIPCLLQVHVAQEESKFGFPAAQFPQLLNDIIDLRVKGRLDHVLIAGVMGMASLTDDQEKIRREFDQLKQLFDQTKALLPGDPVQTLSMGMSSDYRLAIQAGSTMIRIGTALFGERNYTRG
ncbi:MAG TPA: YggS family pyridoxal phosphate-dependent enzyme [Puia sp.]|nr:YggS family pyridoxal phosphate-dependent enzyme [Puia sp.]